MVTTAIMVVAMAGVAAGQQAKCEPAAEYSERLVRVVEIFANPDSFYVNFRAAKGIALLPPKAPRRVVTDVRTCNRLLAAVRAALRGIYKQDEAYTAYTFAFYRVGDYYVAQQIPEPPKDIIVSGYVECLIFRVSDLAFVARLLT